MRKRYAYLFATLSTVNLVACASNEPTSTDAEKWQLHWTSTPKRLVLIQAAFDVNEEWVGRNADWSAAAQEAATSALRERLAAREVELVVPLPNTLPENCLTLADFRSSPKKCGDTIRQSYQADFGVFLSGTNTHDTAGTVAGKTVITTGAFAGEIVGQATLQTACILLLPLCVGVALIASDSDSTSDQQDEPAITSAEADDRDGTMILGSARGLVVSEPGTSSTELYDLRTGYMVWNFSIPEGDWRTLDSANEALDRLFSYAPI